MSLRNNDTFLEIIKPTLRRDKIRLHPSIRIHQSHLVSTKYDWHKNQYQV